MKLILTLGGAKIAWSITTKRPDLEQEPIEVQEFPDKRSEPDIEHLLEASHESPDPDAALEYSQRAAGLSPDDPAVQEHLQTVVFDKLKDDAYVAFLAETDKHYVVSFRGSRPLVVPKARAAVEPFPYREQSEGERTFGLLRWVMLGLIPVGIGALILSPLVIGRALGVLCHRRASARDKKLAWLAILVAGLAGGLGMIFSLALALHVLG